MMENDIILYDMLDVLANLGRIKDTISGTSTLTSCGRNLFEKISIYQDYSSQRRRRRKKED